MRVHLLPCGPFANESERIAANAVRTSLLRIEAPGIAYVLTNLTHPNTHGQADEIDMIVVGPGGAAVVEVKHWEASRLRRTDESDGHADLILTKTRRIAGRLRTVEPTISFVPATFLLTLERGSMRRDGKQIEHPRGVRAYGLKDVDTLCADLARGNLNSEHLAKALAPRQLAEAGPGAKRLGRFDELKLLSPPDDASARVHLARDPATGERVILHSYDFTSALSSDDVALTERCAKRGLDAFPG